MPKTSQQRLFTAFLSASLLLTTAGSADAENTASAAEPNAPSSTGNSFDLQGKNQTIAGNQSVAPAKNPSLAYLQGQTPQGQALPEKTLPEKTLPEKTLQGIVSSATTNIAVRTPLLFLDDLTESALHIKQSIPVPGQASGQAARQSPTLQNLNKSARAFVPDFFNYRPYRVAAQAFLGSEGSGANSGANAASHTSANKAVASVTAERSEDERSQRNKLALTLTATMMQIAKGLGDCDSKAAEQSIERGRNKLTQILGKGQADWVINRMTSWAEQVKVSFAKRSSNSQDLVSQDQEKSNSGEADVLEQEEQVSALVSRAVARDQQISNLKASMSIHDKAPTGAERGLSLVALTPNLIGPVANLAQGAVELGTGGTRGKRLDDVLTMGMAMQERIILLTRESELAVNNLERARNSKNNVLYAFSKDLIAKLGGP